MTVIGLDVGYSNLKIAVSEAGASPRLIVRPAGSAPVDRLGEQIGSTRRQDAVVVEVETEPWAAAIEPVRFEGWQRAGARRRVVEGGRRIRFRFIFCERSLVSPLLW